MYLCCLQVAGLCFLFLHVKSCHLHQPWITSTRFITSLPNCSHYYSCSTSISGSHRHSTTDYTHSVSRQRRKNLLFPSFSSLSPNSFPLSCPSLDSQVTENQAEGVSRQPTTDITANTTTKLTHNTVLCVFRSSLL